MNIFALIIQKLKSFRMTVPSLVLLALASYRTLTSGYSIQLVGICASVVPFMCQFKNFPKGPEGTEPFREALSNYILNLILMAVYLGWVMVLTWAGKALVPGYVVNPNFGDMMLIAVCADVVFISALIPVCQDLKPMQRIMPGIILCNAQLVFMMMASDYVAKCAPGNLAAVALGFIALVLVLTVNFMLIAYKLKKD